MANIFSSTRLTARQSTGGNTGAFREETLRWGELIFTAYYGGMTFAEAAASAGVSCIPETARYYAKEWAYEHGLNMPKHITRKMRSRRTRTSIMAKYPSLEHLSDNGDVEEMAICGIISNELYRCLTTNGVTNVNSATSCGTIWGITDEIRDEFRLVCGY